MSVRRREVLTPLQVATAFVELINTQDLDGLVAALTEESRFFVEGESPAIGKGNLREAWAGYFDAFPGYVVFIDEAYERANVAYLLGHTSGSHVSREIELIPSSVIWRCEVVGDQVAEWSVFAASSANRERFGLGPPAV